MVIEKTLRNSVRAFAAIPVLTVLLSFIPARAQSGAASYVFLIGPGSLCDAGDSGACPAVVKSDGGDTLEISGAGIFNPHQKTVMATGTFTHRSLDGNALETGIWIASELVRFHSYGIATGTLMRGGLAFGRPQLGPMRSRMFASSMPAGGLAVFHVRLLPILGVSKTATLQVNCTLGSVSAERPTEGIRLAFDRGGTEFDEEIGGRALFLLTSPGAIAAAIAQAPKVETTPAPIELQQ